MNQIPSRELRNDVASVLRRVESGQSLRITVRGRPVADLVPIGNRPSTMTWTRFRSGLDSGQADSGLEGELRDALAGSTDDVPAG
jgi:prevent-host-death family protein